MSDSQKMRWNEERIEDSESRRTQNMNRRPPNGGDESKVEARENRVRTKPPPWVSEGFSEGVLRRKERPAFIPRLSKRTAIGTRQRVPYRCPLRRGPERQGDKKRNFVERNDLAKQREEGGKLRVRAGRARWRSLEWPEFLSG